MQNFYMTIYPTPDFLDTVTVIFPYHLYNEKIFQNNLAHISSIFPDFIKKYEQFEYEKQLLERLKFDSQIEKQKKVIEKCEFLMKSSETNLNEGIAPYFWQVHKNVDGYAEDGTHIKANYVLALEKIDE